jgi:hypothetical protein
MLVIIKGIGLLIYIILTMNGLNWLTNLNNLNNEWFNLSFDLIVGG